MFRQCSAPRDGGCLGQPADRLPEVGRSAVLRLDFFTRPGANEVGLARDQFIAMAGEQGWGIDVVQDGGTFCRLLVHGPEDLLVDLALDSAPVRPAKSSAIGPTFAPAELAGRKVIALFDRAAACDFVDVLALGHRFSKAELLVLAREVDAGFEVGVFIDMVGLLDRYSDVDLALGPVNIAELRRFFADWSTELESGS